jgi:hypothetical protein
MEREVARGVDSHAALAKLKVKVKAAVQPKTGRPLCPKAGLPESIKVDADLITLVRGWCLPLIMN